MLTWSVNWILLFFAIVTYIQVKWLLEWGKMEGKSWFFSMENELDHLLIAAISCKGQFAGGDGLLTSHCARIHIIREEMLLQGEAEGIKV